MSEISQEYLSLYFSDEGFREAICELVESERDNKWVDVEVSILRDCGLSKHHYRVYHFSDV